jgi:hypothetical protein
VPLPLPTRLNEVRLSLRTGSPLGPMMLMGTSGVRGGYGATAEGEAEGSGGSSQAASVGAKTHNHAQGQRHATVCLDRAWALDTGHAADC